MSQSFGADADRYDRARPRYPDEMVEAIVDAAPGPSWVDVGIGTGISAGQLQDAGCTVLGVEPDERMAELARARGFEVEVAKFENWDPAGREFDAIAAGQAWHWIDPIGGAARAAGALRTGGRLAAFWNVAEMPIELGDTFSAVYQRVAPELEHYRKSMPGLAAYSVAFVKAAEGIREAGGFSEPELWRFEWERTYTRDEWLDQLPTFGDHSQFPPDKLAAVLAGIGEAIDAAGGSFVLPYTAAVITAARE
jgi:SAM-dependent methyltransferase